MKRIKCRYCDRTTTYGVNEKSGFGHMKMTLGKSKTARILNIFYCDDHAENATKELELFITKSPTP